MPETFMFYIIIHKLQSFNVKQNDIIYLLIDYLICIIKQRCFLQQENLIKQRKIIFSYSNEEKS